RSSPACPRRRGESSSPDDHARAGGRTLRLVRCLLSVLHPRALLPDVTTQPCDRPGAGATGPGGVDRDAQSVVAAGHARDRIPLRLGGAFLLREEPAGHLPVPVVEPDGRLADVLRDGQRQAPVLTVSGRPGPGRRAGWRT